MSGCKLSNAQDFEIITFRKLPFITELADVKVFGGKALEVDYLNTLIRKLTDANLLHNYTIKGLNVICCYTFSKFTHYFQDSQEQQWQVRMDLTFLKSYNFKILPRIQNFDSVNRK